MKCCPTCQHPLSNTSTHILWCPNCGTMVCHDEEAAVPARAKSHAALREALKDLMDVQDATDDCWCDEDGTPQPCEACAARAALALDEGK